MMRITLVVVALLAGYGIHAFAQDRSPIERAAAVFTLTPIPSSSSNDLSFVWLYDAANRRVYVCRTSGTGGTVDCKGKADLP